MVGSDGRGQHTIPVSCTVPCAGVQDPGWTPSGRRIRLHPRDRALRPDQPVGALGRAVHRPPGRQRDAPTVAARHRRRIRGLPRPLRHQRQVPDLPPGTQPGPQDGGVPQRPDGSDVRQLTPWRLAADTPDLSLAAHGPTKDLVVFETFGQGAPKGSQQDIATVPATCHPLAGCTREIRYVTHNGSGPRTSFNPSWSPGGKRIAFTDALFPAGKAGDRRHLDGPARRPRPAGLPLTTIPVPPRLGPLKLPCPMTSKIPRHAPLTCEEESSLTTRDGNGVRFAWLCRWSGGRS